MHIGKCAPTDAELDPPLADVVQGSYLFGDTHRISQGEDMDRQTDSDVLGAGRQVGVDLNVIYWVIWRPVDLLWPLFEGLAGQTLRVLL